MFGLSLRILLNLSSVVGALFALWKGGRAERTGAAIVLANVAIGEAGRFVAHDADPFIRLCNDGLTALLLLGVTLRYGALWMGGVMLFFAAQFSLHSYYLVTGRPQTDRLHAIINNLDWQGVTWCLVIGAAVAWRRRVVAANRAKQPAP